MSDEAEAEAEAEGDDDDVALLEEEAEQVVLVADEVIKNLSDFLLNHSFFFSLW